MKINQQALPHIEYFRFVQNVQNKDEYCSTGTIFDFIEGSSKEHYSQEEINEKILDWMYDEFFIYKVPKAKINSLEELYYSGNCLTTLNKEHWIAHIENRSLDTIPLSDKEFVETFGWGINIWLFDHRAINIKFPFEAATNKVQIFEETNPLFLGCEYDDHYYLFNYNGYT